MGGVRTFRCESADQSNPTKEIKMRHPGAVAMRIKEVVPEEHKPFLAQMAYDFSYKDPKQFKACWIELSTFCNEILLDEEWKKKMVKILTEKEIKDNLCR
jgi:hypothetical protein